MFCLDRPHSTCDFFSATSIYRPSLQNRTLLRMIPMPKVNIAEKFSKISEYWKPYIAAELNGQHVKLVLFEPASTLNTGNVVNERTQRHLERV